MKLRILLLLLLLAHALPAQLTFDDFATVSDPIDLQDANDGSDRLFVAQKNGQIVILNKLGERLGVLLDISSQVRNAGERGLLGLAFHPDFSDNGFYFVNYVNNSDQTIVSRFKASGNSTEVNSEVVLLNIQQPYNNHNGGALQFGTDGYLYVATGDGGSGGDPEDRAQNLNSLHGKLLRIDASTEADADPAYTIPADNPFVGVAGLDEIWAYGLRNPWRFSFDRSNGDVWIGDVGQSNQEEINHATNEPGLNYGWRCREGSAAFNMNGCGASGYVEPVFTYETGSNDGRSVTGGYILDDLVYPNFAGHYIFGDYASGQLWTIAPSTSRAAMTAVVIPNVNVGDLSSFGEDAEGNTYALSRQGTIFKISDSGALPVSMLSANIKQQDKRVLIEWITGSEINVSHFEVQVRDETGQFVTVGIVEAQGQSKEPISYSFAHIPDQPGLVFYRLRSTDLDGSSSFSMILDIEVQGDLFEVFPNPAKHTSTVKFQQSVDGWLILQNLNGQRLRSYKIVDGQSTIDLELSDLPGGLIVLRFESNHHQIKRKLLISR